MIPARPRGDADVQRLEATWADPSGVYGWFTHVDHKSIGRRYLVTAFAFFLIGGVLAALMRVQLSRPGNIFLGPVWNSKGASSTIRYWLKENPPAPSITTGVLMR